MEHFDAGGVMHRSRWTRIAQDRGSTVIEFAMVLPVIALIFMGILDFGRYFFTRITLQHAVHEAGRFAITGNALSDANGDPMTRVESIKQVIVDNATSLDVDVNLVEVDPVDGGGPGQIVTVRSSFTFEFLTPGIQAMVPGGAHDFTVTTTMKNEPFFANQQP